MKLLRLFSLRTGASVVALCLSGMASAQNAPAAPAGDATPQVADQTGDIIVTAQKREERLSEVPLSVTAASGEQLIKQGITATDQLERIVPGFTFQATPLGIPVFTIRGIGFFDGTSVGGAPAVGIYLDQVPLPYSVMARGATLDLERVEALKGPQGTLFGQSTTGGAINYVAAKPTQELKAGADLSYGRFNAVSGSAYVGGALAPTLTVRAAGRYDHQDGWQKQYLPANARLGAMAGDRLGRRRFATGRLLLDWAPSSAVRFELGVNGWKDNSDTPGLRFIRFLPKAPRSPFNAAAYAALSPFTAEYPREARLAGWDPNTDFDRDDHFYQVSLRGDADVADAVTLTSVTAYSRYFENSLSDADGTSYRDLANQRIARIRSFSQELRLAGDADRIRWMIGGNYADDVSNECSVAAIFATNNGAGPFRYTRNVNLNLQKVKTYAAFGSLDFKLTDQLMVAGSARYTRQDRDFQGCTGDAGDGSFAAVFRSAFGLNTVAGGCVTQVAPPPTPPALVVPNVTGRLDEDNLSFRGSLNYKPTADTLVYASVAKGYKPGSFPIVPAIYRTQFDPVTQESVIAYEGGVKASLADRRVQLSAAGFYYDYHDKQLQGVASFPIFGNLPRLVNIPKSRVYGIDVEISARPLDGLRLSTGLTYVNSKALADPGNPVDALGASKTFIGQSFPSTPRWQAVGDAEYRFAAGGSKMAFVGASLTARSSTYAAFGENADFRIKGYALLDVRAGIEAADGRWRAELFGRNVTDKFYQAGITYTVDTIVGIAGMPATYGVRLSYRY